VTITELEKTLAILERISKQFPPGSEEAKAIELSAEAILYISQVETRTDFLKYLAGRDEPLTEAQTLHLRAMGIDPDTFDGDQ
jgi:hypothetical protein